MDAVLMFSLCLEGILIKNSRWQRIGCVVAGFLLFKFNPLFPCLRKQKQNIYCDLREMIF